VKRKLLGVRRGMHRLFIVVVAGVLVALLGAPAASAHPLGNFTVNSYSGLTIEPTAIAVQLVVDTAEIPTLQAFPQINSEQGVPQDRQNGYRVAQCVRLAAGVRLSVEGVVVLVKVIGSTLSFPPGSAGLHTMRLTCDTRTPEPVDTPDRRIVYRDLNSLDRIGWHEITAVGDGVRLSRSDVPATSRSQVLSAYPVDLLSSPLDQRGADISVALGTGVVTGDAARHVDDPSTAMPRGVDRLTTAFTDLVASRNLTAGFGIVAFLLSIVLGGMHAFAPGHGKTLMAAYLVGRRSSLRQAATIGLSVTLTHTFGVLALGVVLSLVVVASPERVYPWLGLASGIMLAGIGITLLRNGLAARRRSLVEIAETALSATTAPQTPPARATAATAATRPMVSTYARQQRTSGVGGIAGKGPTLTLPTGIDGRSGVFDPVRTQDHPHVHRPDGSHGHTRQGDPHDGHTRDGHTHDQVGVDGMHSHGVFSHTHLPPAGSEATGARSMLAVGFAGGLVPSPSALVVLLGGIALGRAWFGVLLVVAYGIGMALALVGTGLVLVKARDRLHRWAEASARTRRSGVVLLLTRALPTLTAIVVVGAGVSVAVRAIVSM